MEMVPEGERHSEEGPSSTVTLTASTPPPTLLTASPYPYHGKQDESKSHAQTLSERKLRDICFRCRKQGHWAQDCPSSSPTKASSSQHSTPEVDIHHLPVLRCHCGVACTISVSRSQANPDRRYYTRKCSCDYVKALASTQGKKFFQWCDNVKAPMCKCGAGACTINIQKDNNGKDIKYYTCRIRTGHGSCDFFQFESPPNSMTAPRSMEKDKRSSSVLRSKLGECSSIPSFSNRNIVVPEVGRCNLVMGKGHFVSNLTSLSDIHFRQIEFWNQISDAGNSPNGCEVLQNLGLHVHGWMGRLAFPPPRILADPPLRHFFCCIYPLFDPILEYVDISDSGSSRIMPYASSDAEVSQNAFRNNTQILGVPFETSSLKRSFTAMQEDVTNPILKEIGKKLQKDLLNLLESMEPHDHDNMLKAANATFDALACLSIECGPFTERVMKFIQCTSRVTPMESTVQDNCNLEKCLVDISGIHAETLSTLTSSSNYLQSARNKACHLNDKLHQIENQLHHCMTETSKLEIFLLDIAKDVGQSKKSMQTAHQELTKALKLQQEEEEQCMENTALEETCSSSSEIYGLHQRKRQKIMRQKRIKNYFNIEASDVWQ